MRAELRRAVSALPGPLPEPVLAALGASNEPEAFAKALESVEKVGWFSLRGTKIIHCCTLHADAPISKCFCPHAFLSQPDVAAVVQAVVLVCMRTE
jgi:hypothetical protein